MNKLTETLINIRLLLRGRPIRVSIQKEPIYRVSDDDMQIKICRPGRYNRYKRGIKRGIEAIASDYHLDTLDELSGGTFIDCGANVGELGVWAQSRGLIYIAFEPERLEADCCDSNNYHGRSVTIRKALWKETTTLEFYHKAATADSSTFPLADYTSKTHIPAVRLDDEINLAEIVQPLILKIEAEGAEPEVLQGSKNILKVADYVTVDCGYERGENQDHTFVEVNQTLSEADFTIIAAKFTGRVTVLYKKRKN